MTTETWLRSLGRKPTMTEVNERDEELADYFEHNFDPVNPPPWCELAIGPDGKGRLLEIGLVHTSDDDEGVIVHAMELRASWYPLVLESFPKL